MQFLKLALRTYQLFRHNKKTREEILALREKMFRKVLKYAFYNSDVKNFDDLTTCPELKRKAIEEFG